MQIQTMQDINQAVRQARTEKGLTQSQVASLLGYSTKWVSDFENGKVSPPLDMALNVLNLLGLKVHVLTPGEPSPSLPPTFEDEEEEIDIEKGLDPRW